MSVIGQAAGIEHGTVKGYRQHIYREVPTSPGCGCRKALSDDKAAKKTTSPKSTRPASATAKAWNGGMTGEAPVQLQPRPLTGECPADGCGAKSADTGRSGSDMVHVAVPGSREAARWYCPGWCAVYGQALAEIRAIPVTTPEGGDGP